MGGPVVDGTEVAEGGVAAGGVVKGFDVVEHRSSELGAGVPVVPIEEFALQGRGERLGDRRVERVTDGAVLVCTRRRRPASA